MAEFSHIDAEGQARMVDVSAKPTVYREATAIAEILLQQETVERIESRTLTKGNVIATARLAGIMAAKRASELIPLCHPLVISHCDLDLSVPPSKDRLIITARVRCTGQTGVEMEALTGVSVAALTVYDMCKAVDDRMVIGGIRLLEKTKRAVSDLPRP
jgi:cyclic pyranopterin phosphate synthase